MAAQGDVAAVRLLYLLVRQGRVGDLPGRQPKTGSGVACPVDIFVGTCVSQYDFVRTGALEDAVRKTKEVVVFGFEEGPALGEVGRLSSLFTTL